MARLLPGGAYAVDVCGEMTWPAPGERLADLEWKLRYAPAALSRADHMVLASVVAAYGQMVGDPARKRGAVVAEIRAAVRAGVAVTDGDGGP